MRTVTNNLLAVLAIVCTAIPVAAESRPPKPNVIATFNGRELTARELEKWTYFSMAGVQSLQALNTIADPALWDLAYCNVLRKYADKYIRVSLFVAEARKSGKVNEQEIRREFSMFDEPGNHEFTEYLIAQRISERYLDVLSPDPTTREAVYTRETNKLWDESRAEVFSSCVLEKREQGHGDDSRARPTF